MKTSPFYFLVLTLLLFTGLARAQDCSASKDLPNFGCVNAKVFRGAQPTEEGIKELARRGVKTIIDLRDADERARLEEGWARNAGIKFINVPLNNWFAPKDSEIKRILELIDSSQNQPIFVHCKRGADRTGTVIAVYRIAHDGWTASQAKNEAKNFRFGWWQLWMKDYIKDYYKANGNRKSKNTRIAVNNNFWRFF